MEDIRKWADEHFIELVEKDVWADAKKALEQAKGIHEAIAEITRAISALEAHGLMNEVHALNFAIQIIDKHTGVNE